VRSAGIEARLELLDDRNLSVTGRHAHDRSNLAGGRIVVELRAEDVIRGHNSLERRLNHFTRGRRDHEEGELAAVDTALEEFDERGNIAAQPDALSGFLEMLASNSSELGVWRSR
jgi:hypothetical protein